MLKNILTRRNIPAWLILGLGVLVTVFISLQIKDIIENNAKKQFAFNCDQVTVKIGERLRSYALVLRSGAGFIEGSENVTRIEWQDFINILRAKDSIPGVQGIGFSQVISPNQLSKHIARVRSEGFSEYTVWPSGERYVYSAIIYLEPFRDRNLRAHGYDMLSEPVRRIAMDEARDTGKVILSGKVTLVQETDTEVQSGALMYMPVYRKNEPTDSVEQKRAALAGWVYSPYRMNDLMNGILHDWESHEGKWVALNIYDGLRATPGSLLFDSNVNHTPVTSSIFYLTRTIEFNGRQWLLVFDSTLSTSGIAYAGAWMTLIGGILISSLLFGLMLSVINTRTSAEGIASKLTKEIRDRETLLRESEYRWKYAVEGSGDGLWDANLVVGTTFFSKQWKAILGYDDHEIKNSLTEWEDRIHPDDRENTLSKLHHYIDGNTEKNSTEHRLLCKDGSYKWVLGRGIFVIRNEAGKPLRMIGTIQDISERKQAEAARNESEGKFRALFDMSPIGIAYHEMIYDTSGNAIDYRFLDTNESFLELVGVDPRGKTARQAFPEIESDPFDWIGTYDKVTRTGVTLRFERHFQTNNRWYECVAYPYKSGQFVVAFLEISKRKQAEDALRESEGRYSIMFEQNIVPMLLIDVADGHIVDANRQACVFYGWDADAMRSMSIRDLNTIGSEHLLPELGRALHFNKRQLFFLHRRASGELRDVEFFSGPVVLSGKTLLLSSITDITERKKTELALRDSESFNTTVLDSLVEHIAVLDFEGVIVSVNSAWLQFARKNGAPELAEHWLGLNYIDICGTSFNKYDNSEGALAQAGIHTVLSGEKTNFEMEYACHSPEEQRWFIMHVTPLKGANLGVVVAHENITHRKLSEIAIQASHTRLEELTLQLIDAQEQERKSIARELHDELGQRFATLKINLHQMRPHLVDTSGESTWQRASDDVTALIAQMRSISSALRPPMLDYLGLEVSISQLLQQNFSNSPITYVLEYAGLPYKIAEQIEITVYRIIQESITNIVRHADASHVIVEVNGGENASDIEIIIRDNGIGFDTSHVDMSQQRSFGLIGMGERVKLLNGELHVSSVIGSGTRITALLPLKND